MDEKNGNLAAIRKMIDAIDSQILKLLNERMELGLWTKKLKGGVTDAKREEEVLQKVNLNPVGLIQPEMREKIFASIISESKRLQSQDLKLVGFQGEHGAYSELAARAHDKSLVPIPCMEFQDVFEGVESGQLDCGVVPVENSLEGSVTSVNDLLVETGLKIVAEVRTPIHHCLLALPDTDYREIRVVYSHPQALGQCRGFLARNKLEPRPFYDTAGAAKMLSAERPKAVAVIASGLCAELYGLEIIKENIEDHESNSTRFLVLSRENALGSGNKCSIMFSTKHKAGALFGVLKAFADSGINLTRIESRPIRNDPGKFAFLLDFQGREDDGKVTGALALAREECASFKVLGFYKEAEK
jgi:prephenate dehydratase/chorismate mutase/prephenate dehydratase